MNPYSIKFTIRSFFRDILRGWWARNIIYPSLRQNEHCKNTLDNFIKKQQTQNNIPPKYLPATTYRISKSNSHFIDKNTIRNNPAAFIKPRKPSTFLRSKISTSGSTGRPLTLIQDLRAIIREEAFVYRQLRWAGYKYRDRRVWLRGDIVCSGPTKGGVYGCRDWWTNTLMLSSYHIAPNTAESYLRALSDFDPVLIQAYPSSIHALASWMLANNVSYAGKSLRSIVTSSETLDPDTQKQIEQVFGCKVFDWYGQAERVTAIATCEYGRHHMLTDYGLVELYPEGNDLYELVGTSYNNLTMPLMHYRTGDLVRKFDEECPCGRIFPVITEILGRRDKIVTLPDGRQIGRLDHIFKGLDSIFEGQIAYQGKGHFSIRISVTSDWKDSDADHLIRQLTERISNITASVDIVDSIPRGANGKFEFVRIEEDQ